MQIVKFKTVFAAVCAAGFLTAAPEKSEAGLFDCLFKDRSCCYDPCCAPPPCCPTPVCYQKPTCCPQPVCAPRPVCPQPVCSKPCCGHVHHVGCGCGHVHTGCCGHGYVNRGYYGSTYAYGVRRPFLYTPVSVRRSYYYGY